MAWQGLRGYMLEYMRSLGYTDIGAAHWNLFRNPGIDGMRPGEIAEELNASKQAVNDLLRDLEEMGYITREIDPTDRRARIVRLTRTGQKLEKHMFEAARQAEHRLEKGIGKGRVKELRNALIESAEIYNEHS